MDIKYVELAKVGIMNLEDKAEDYCNKIGLTYWMKPMPKLHYTEGFKSCAEYADDIQKANPKMSASDLVKELKKLL